MSKNRSPLFVIFLTVFIDLIGFGIIIPLSPYLAKEHGATPFQVGLLMAVYSFMQFVFSPIWGRLSDRYGRRPIILVSLLGTGLAHTAFAFSSTLSMLFLSRTFAGVAGGNLSTAMAYVADVTGAKDRSKGMGLVGAAFGLGFIFGPVLGGVMGDVGLKISTQPPFGMGFPALGAAALCFINFLLALRILKESLPAEKRTPRPKVHSRWEGATEYFRRPVIGPLLLVSFLTIFAFAHMEAVLFLLVNERFGWTMTTASFAFAYVGVVSAFTQGYLVRKFLPKWGERKTMVWGLTLSGLGLLLIGFSPTPWVMALVITVMSVGVGLRNPSILGSISVKAGGHEQGGVMGINQSLASLGRILGPPLGGMLYAWYIPSPFVVAGVATLACLGIVWQIYDEIPDAGKGETPEPSRNSSAPVGSPASSNEKLTFISEDQLQNLIKRRIPFLFVDLREPGLKPFFNLAVNSSRESLLEDVNSRVPDKTFPVVLICENGELSLAAATELQRNNFLNVVVLEGGTANLKS